MNALPSIADLLTGADAVDLPPMPLPTLRELLGEPPAGKRARAVVAPAPVPAVEPDSNILDRNIGEPGVPSLRVILRVRAERDPNRLPWPDEWFDHSDSAQFDACRALWGDALRMMLMGVCEVVIGRRSFDVRVGDGWLGTRDYRIVCSLAGFDPDALHERLTEILSTREGAFDLRFRLTHGKPMTRGAA